MERHRSEYVDVAARCVRARERGKEAQRINLARGERAKSAQDTGVVCERVRGGAFDFESDGVPELPRSGSFSARLCGRLFQTKIYEMLYASRRHARTSHWIALHVQTLSTSALFGLAALAARHTPHARPSLRRALVHACSITVAAAAVAAACRAAVAYAEA